ncbi:MAG: type II secretion system protein, partial [Gammaproteobacteria bacterium]
MSDQIRTAKKYHHHVTGLTLIETMLVVVVIAIATLASIKIIKNRTAANAIDQVVAQMQNVAQATVAYYMVNGEWPTTANQAAGYPSPLLTALTTTNTTPGKMNKNYITPEAFCTPFPADNTSSFCQNFAEIQGQAPTNTAQQAYYNLTLTTNDATTALAIAGKLANAQVTGTTITMSVLPPTNYFYTGSGFNNPNQGWIVSAGLISFYQSATNNDGCNSSNCTSTSAAPLNLMNGTSVTLPNCPYGFEGHIIYAPQRYQTAAG